MAGAVAAVMLFGQPWPKHTVASPTPKVSTGPTAKELYTAKYMKRADGTIAAITATDITVSITGTATPLILKLTPDTAYMAGSQGKSVDRAAILKGQKAAVGYDSGAMTAISIWGGYNE